MTVLSAGTWRQGHGRRERERRTSREETEATLVDFGCLGPAKDVHPAQIILRDYLA